MSDIYIPDTLQTEVARFLEERQKYPLRTITIKWECSADITFEVFGDLYEGETAALAVMSELRKGFPQVLFDVMVKPEP